MVLIVMIKSTKKSVAEFINTIKDIAAYSVPAEVFEADITCRLSDGLLACYMAGEIGFSGLPESVDRKTFEKYIALKEVELYRGFTHPEYKRNFMEGEYFAGTGIDGSGIYTAAGENAYNVALAYTEGNDPDCVLRMCLNKEAKVITRRKMQELWYEELREKKKELEQIEDFSREKLLKIHIRLINDTGRWAISRGYDAMDTGDINGLRDVLVFNRTALRVLN
jgi:hypothetical protein